jgi:hypothetical protein
MVCPTTSVVFDPWYATEDLTGIHKETGDDDDDDDGKICNPGGKENERVTLSNDTKDKDEPKKVLKRQYREVKFKKPLEVYISPPLGERRSSCYTFLTTVRMETSRRKEGKG